MPAKCCEEASVHVQFPSTEQYRLCRVATGQLSTSLPVHWSHCCAWNCLPCFLAAWLAHAKGPEAQKPYTCKSICYFTWVLHLWGQYMPYRHARIPVPANPHQEFCNSELPRPGWQSAQLQRALCIYRVLGTYLVSAQFMGLWGHQRMHPCDSLQQAYLSKTIDGKK